MKTTDALYYFLKEIYDNGEFGDFPLWFLNDEVRAEYQISFILQNRIFQYSKTLWGETIDNTQACFLVDEFLKIITCEIGKANGCEIDCTIIREKYSDYLKSEHWQKTRKKALRRAKFKCQLCGKNNIVLHIHHNNYDNIGQEENSDLIALCENCHANYHKQAI